MKAAPRDRMTLARIAEQELRALVLGGKIQAGARINEVAIAEELGISRGPLREAIQRLASEGLLTVVPHRGAYVPTVTEAELRDLYELRVAIETYAVRLGAERGTGEQKERLQAVLDKTGRILDSGETVPYPVDLDIHVQMVSMSQNQSLVEAMREAHTKIHLARARSAYEPHRARTAYEEHKRIVEMILRGNGTAAVELLEEHLFASLDNALLLMRQSDSGPTAPR